ncbi:hypothetical protein Nizo2259_0331 [Lactiplantibacillus plantarum]|uniref:Uncharacterized protein n=2 Tax=Lactiplantibacillus plantarum TaxID=1590 RepID=A0A166MSA4_LACPN|nr:hypothetical protein LPST_C0857 [Lactiplantibacillus plantarum ST-III]AGE38645.1 Hypothetical protein zj316_1106 [Lactiplantibacillus plantarum ZJ316]AGL63589.2 hypothetical protein LBP_cg0843 [Lactiplantibacillus plantarum subsp. plantarum P-8]ALC08067.1 hypothetical protein JM48_0857 [Lactiplantibacillus plantarum]ERJ50019.1 hypothetical protein N574_13755 [Lactiplantibacillus plantarum 2165]ERO41227.1 hypothetical protein LPLWJ_16460 [Lactiplantibacillus plantarum WJL]ETF11905.1 hypothe
MFLIEQPQKFVTQLGTTLSKLNPYMDIGLKNNSGGEC